jgi:hypothetical protein
MAAVGQDRDRAEPAELGPDDVPQLVLAGLEPASGIEQETFPVHA